MRVSPIAWLFDTLHQVHFEAIKSAKLTHNHPEGVKGAVAVAEAIFLARKGVSKAEIRSRICGVYGYNLNFSLDEIRPTYRFDMTCPGSVPQAVVAFLESDDFESAIRNAISIGGDSDTIASMAGGIAEAYYSHIPLGVVNEALARLDQYLSDLLFQFIIQVEEITKCLPPCSKRKNKSLAIINKQLVGVTDLNL